MKYANLTLRVDKCTIDILRKLAKEQERSVNSYMNIIVRKHLEQRSKECGKEQRKEDLMKVKGAGPSV